MYAINTCRKLVEEAWSASAKWESNYTEAERLLRIELSNTGPSVLVLTCLGAVLCDQAKYKEASVLLQRAVDLGSTDRNTYTSLGVALMNTATHEEAMTMFKKAQGLKANAQSIEAYFDPQAQ